MISKMSFLLRKNPEHKISPQDIDPDALSVLRRLNKSGFVAYLVGGGVRDLLLGRTPKDFDIATSASPKQIRNLFRNSFLIGRRFRLALIRFGNKQIETATFRRSPEPDEMDAAGDAPGALYQDEDNLFGTPEEDAQRRDFTVNALFYDVTSSKIIDYTGGLRDISKKVLRAIGDPNIRFREDPVRMLRAVRLSARLDFTIHADSNKAITRHSSEIMQASKPRLFEEINRLFTYSKSEAAFRLLWESKLMHELLPQVDAFINENGKKKSVVWNFFSALDETAPPLETTDRHSPYYVLETPLRMAVLLAPLFFDACKTEGEGGRVNAAKIAEDLVNDILVAPYSTGSWRIPRLMCQDTVNILESASYFRSQNIRRSRYFRQPWFYTSLVFWRICAEARDNRPVLPTIESWETAFEEFVQANSKRPSQDTATPNPAEFESEEEQRDSLFPPKKHHRRRSRHRRHSSGSPSTESAPEAKKDDAP